MHWGIFFGIAEAALGVAGPAFEGVGTFAGALLLRVSCAHTRPVMLRKRKRIIIFFSIYPPGVYRSNLSGINSGDYFNRAKRIVNRNILRDRNAGNFLNFLDSPSMNSLSHKCLQISVKKLTMQKMNTV